MIKRLKHYLLLLIVMTASQWANAQPTSFEVMRFRVKSKNVTADPDIDSAIVISGKFYHAQCLPDSLYTDIYIEDHFRQDVRYIKDTLISEKIVLKLYRNNQEYTYTIYNPPVRKSEFTYLYLGDLDEEKRLEYEVPENCCQESTVRSRGRDIIIADISPYRRKPAGTKKIRRKR